MKNLSLALLLCIPFISTTAKANRFWNAVLPAADQGVVREERPLTIGLPLSEPYNLPSQYQLRFGKQFLLGSNIMSESVDEDNGSNDSYGSRYGANTFWSLNKNSVSAYAEYYPKESSGFHVGFGVESRWGSYTESVLEQGDKKKVAKGNYHGLYAGPSFGWTGIWNCGLTIGFDVSTRKRQSYEISRSELAPGAKEGSFDKLQDRALPKTDRGMIVLGYSF